HGLKKIFVTAIDVPAATSFYETKEGVDTFKTAGLDFELVRIPPTAADVTPEMQRIAANGPKTLVQMIGGSAQCIAVMNGLRAAGFTGVITGVQQCIDDSTRKAVPGDFL